MHNEPILYILYKILNFSNNDTKISTWQLLCNCMTDAFLHPQKLIIIIVQMLKNNWKQSQMTINFRNSPEGLSHKSLSIAVFVLEYAVSTKKEH